MDGKHLVSLRLSLGPDKGDCNSPVFVHNQQNMTKKRGRKVHKNHPHLQQLYFVEFN